MIVIVAYTEMEVGMRSYHLCGSLLFCVIISLDKVSSWDTKLQTTAHVSGWIPMRSQDNNLSYHVWNHNLNDLPVRVDVQVKPQTGTDTDYVFPGIAAAQRDDSLKVPYGGIVYKYNKDSVMLFAPNKHSGHPSGHAIYTGGSVWNGPKQQCSSNVLTRVRVWGEQHFPYPDFKMNWTPIRMGEASPREIPHGLGVPPAYVVLQIKLGSTEDVADGIGYMMAIESSLKGDKWGGVPYAYDDKNIRVWTRYIGGSLFAIPEGWGNSKENFKSGQYRIFAWKSLKAKTKTVQKLSLPSRSNTEIRFHTGINQTCDIVQVMVKELPNRSGSNENAGYLFKATGAVQNTRANNSYGGVVYSYSSQSLRVWYPPVNDTGKNYLVYLDNLFGKSSTATRAELEITTLVPYDAIPKTTSKEMTASLLPITKRITQLQQKSTRDRTLHLTTKSKTTSHSDTLTTTSSMAITASSIPITRGTARLLQKSTESPKLTTKNKTTLHSERYTCRFSFAAKEDMTDTLCQFDFWIYILIGFGICLVPVFIIWLFWFCLRSVSKDAKVSIE